MILEFSSAKQKQEKGSMKIHDALHVLGTMSQPCWDHKPIFEKKTQQQNKMIKHGT